MQNASLDSPTPFPHMEIIQLEWKDLMKSLWRTDWKLDISFVYQVSLFPNKYSLRCTFSFNPSVFFFFLLLVLSINHRDRLLIPSISAEIIISSSIIPNFPLTLLIIGSSAGSLSNFPGGDFVFFLPLGTVLHYNHYHYAIMIPSI